MPNFRPLSETKFINDANLVSYWKLDGNSNDSKGSNNGTDTAISYTTENFGQVAGFTGTDNTALSSISHIQISPITLGSNFSVLCWCKIGATQNQFAVYSNREGASQSTPWMGLWIKKTSVEAELQGSGGAGNYINVVTSTSIFNDNKYHLCAFTMTSNTSLSIYVDGALLSTTSTPNATRDSGSTTFIGTYRYGAGATNYYGSNATADDIAIFSRALSASEVNELYQGMTLGEYLPNSSTKLLLHLNGSSVDSSGNGNNGTDTAITWVDGKFGKCASFNGSSSKINITSINLKQYNDKTVSFWIKLTNNTDTKYQRLISDETVNSDANVEFFVRPSSKTIGVSTKDTVGAKEILVTSLINSGTWYNVIGVISKNNYIKLFLDGSQIGSTTTIGDNSGHGATNLLIGLANYSGAFEFFNGLMDEIIIENRAWSASEVKKYYTYAKGRFGII